jgi:hypothetical protein
LLPFDVLFVSHVSPHYLLQYLDFSYLFIYFPVGSVQIFDFVVYFFGQDFNIFFSRFVLKFTFDELVFEFFFLFSEFLDLINNLSLIISFFLVSFVIDLFVIFGGATQMRAPDRSRGFTS